MKKFLVLSLLLMVILSLTACAAGPNVLADSETDDAEIAGFWLGLWHGFISPVTFVISLFNDTVNVYEVFNNGGWYNFGFMFGMSIIFGGSGRQSRKARK